jgi:hypothetical protein
MCLLTPPAHIRHSISPVMDGLFICKDMGDRGKHNFFPIVVSGYMKKKVPPGIVVHTCNPRTWEVEAGGS